MRALILAFLCLGLVSCSPVYKTTYHLKPPESEQGRHCANRCLSKKQSCYQHCENLKSQCQSRKEITNLAEVVIDALEKSKNDDQTNRSRYRSEKNCDQEEQKCISRCDSIHRLCHENCGGVVIREETCIRNCDKE